MSSTPQNGQVPCMSCPLADCPGLRPHSPAQAQYLQQFKQGEWKVGRGQAVLVQGEYSAAVFTVLSGVLMRFKLLEDGRRQIVNFMFPGDLVGLQAAMGEPLGHGVEALTDAVLCQFPRDRFHELSRHHPDLGFDVIWLAAKEEQALEEHLVALGQRTARERIAYLAVFLVERGMATGIARDNRLELTINQTQIADMMGLSLVHTNRTLQSLRQAGLIAWNQNEIRIADLNAAREYARLDGPLLAPRPYL